MANIQCKMCGGVNELQDGVTSGVCQYCGIHAHAKKGFPWCWPACDPIPRPSRSKPLLEQMVCTFLRAHDLLGAFSQG